MVKICRLYASALDLYGDYRNLDGIVRYLAQAGIEAEIEEVEHWQDFEPSKYDLIYIGHGKIRNLVAVSEHFLKHGEKIKENIDNNQLWLVIGNSRELFGTSFTDEKNESHQGLGLFPYKGVECNKVNVADMIGKTSFSENYCYGFANRTCYLEYEKANDKPLFIEAKGFTDSLESEGVEGTLYRNFIASFALGPLLLRNPELMKRILSLLKADTSKCDFSLAQKALEEVLKEFKEIKS